MPRRCGRQGSGHAARLGPASKSSLLEAKLGEIAVAVDAIAKAEAPKTKAEKAKVKRKVNAKVREMLAPVAVHVDNLRTPTAPAADPKPAAKPSPPDVYSECIRLSAGATEDECVAAIRVFGNRLRCLDSKYFARIDGG